MTKKHHFTPVMQGFLLALGVTSPVLSWAQATASAESALNAGALIQPINQDKLKNCLFLADDQLRVRCYDDALGRSKAVEKADSPVAVASLDGAYMLYKDPNILTSSLLDKRWELDADSKRGTFQLRPYKPVYLLPFFRTNHVNNRPTSENPANQVLTDNDITQNEAKFQLSLKTKVVENLFGDNGDIWFGYTQSSRWQVYNQTTSRPFRETNYEPEAMFTWRSSWRGMEEATGWSPSMLGLSVNHQSNGRALPLSRSWNRVIGLIGLEKGNTVVQLRPWVRLPEKRGDDDNPNIQDYVGRGDMLLVHKYAGNEFSMMLRHSLRGGDRSRGAVQLDWGFPVTAALRGHVQIFSGYGESLIDYNFKANYLGLGFSLVDWY